jgi:DNA-binding LacI/PurR family transcriptional regulator
VSSVRAIATQLNLSAATVSRVLNNHANVDAETRERVLTCINKLGYFPSVGRRLSNVIALAYPDDPVQTEYGSFESALLTGIMRGLGEQQFDLKLLSIQRDKSPRETYTQFFLRKGVRGVILRCFRQSRPMILKIAQEGFPAIVVAEHFDEPRVHSIRATSYPSSRRAMEHLISLGHRRIVLAVHNVLDSDHADRRRAYADALHCAEIPVDNALIMKDMPASCSSGEHVLDAILAMRDRPTAVFATNPMTALGIMRRAQERGVRVPQDLSVVGMDDSDIRQHVWPRMTAVCQDATALGYEAALWLSSVALRGGALGERYVRELPTTFEVNGTTGPAPAARTGAGGASGEDSDERSEGPSRRAPRSKKRSAE